MNFKLGEFVRFVNERIEGHITRIIDKDTVAVTDQDGFEIPVLTSQITRVHGQFSGDRKEEQPPEAVVEEKGEFRHEGIFLAVVPDQRSSAVVHFHLLNETGYQLLAALKTEKDQAFKGEFSGVVEPSSAIKIFSASLNELDKWPTFNVQAILFSTGNRAPVEPLVFKYKFRAKDFAGAKKNTELIDQPAWLTQLDKPVVPVDAQKLKESFHKPAEEKARIENPGKEVDLHIEKLRDDHQFLSNSEKLKIQLALFQKALDGAIVHKLASIIFIHGVGNGTLRNEIHKAVSKHPQVKTFMDARKEKFGFGATEVFLK